MEVIQKRAAGGSIASWSSTRRGTIVIALLATLLAAGILLVAAKQYRKSVIATTKPATVLVATRLIEQGTAGASIGVGHYFKAEKILAKNVSQGAFSDTAALHGRIANTDIYPGQQLNAADFTGAGDIPSRLAAAERAISVPLTTSHGLIGNVSTGDRVDVYVTFKREGNKAAALRLVAPNIVVLKAGELSGSGIGANKNSATATANVVLEVTSHQAAEIAFGVDNGKVWLVQRPADGQRAGEEIITEESILAGNPAGLAGGKP